MSAFLELVGRLSGGYRDISSADARFLSPLIYPPGSRSALSRSVNRLAKQLSHIANLLRARFPGPVAASPVYFFDRADRLFVVGYHEPIGVRIECEFVPFELVDDGEQPVRWDLVFDSGADELNQHGRVVALRRQSDGEIVDIVGQDFPQWLFVPDHIKAQNAAGVE